jgi:hypothetical protein
MDLNETLSELQGTLGSRLVVAVSNQGENASTVSLVTGILRQAPAVQTPNGTTIVFELAELVGGVEQRVGGFMLPEGRFEGAGIVDGVLIVKIDRCRLMISGVSQQDED